MQSVVSKRNSFTTRNVFGFIWQHCILYIYLVFSKKPRLQSSKSTGITMQFKYFNPTQNHPLYDLRCSFMDARMSVSFIVEYKLCICSRMLQQLSGSFNNYVDKMRWVGGLKMPIFVNVQSINYKMSTQRQVIDTVQDFLIKLGIKPCLHILKT